MEQDNFDFYQEALKAFDAPIPQPEPEKPAPEPTVEVTAPVQQEKPKRRFNPWWGVALCGVLCLALLIGFGREPENVCRGENYVYGILLEATDEYMIISHHQMFWYVELNGLENPYDRFGVDTYLWVFYNGEADKTDLRGCDRKITATYWKADETQGDWEDKIDFDLDGDGVAENWSLVRTVWKDHVINVPSMNITLTAKDSEGTILHNAHFYLPSSTDSVVFQNSDDGLSLVISRLATYEVLQMRIENGKLAVYWDGETQKLYPHETEPEPVITGPLMTYPEVPTLGSTEPYTIRFSLNVQTGAVPQTKRMIMTVSEGMLLKGLLDSLEWTNMDDVIYMPIWSFDFQEMEQQSTYHVTGDGVILHDGKQASLSTQLRELLLEQLGWKMPNAQEYITYLQNGDIASLIFFADGRVHVRVSDYFATDPKTYMGRYVTIENYYLLDLGEDPLQLMVLKQKDRSLAYVADLSKQTMFPEEDRLEFRLGDYGGCIELSVRNMWGNDASSMKRQILSVIQTWQLKQMLENCNWQTDIAYTDEQILAHFTIFDGVGDDVCNPTQYYILTGGRLLRQGQSPAVATVDTQHLWQTMVSYFAQLGTPMNAVYVGNNQDGMQIQLELLENGSCHISAQLKHEDGDGYQVLGQSSSYVHLGDSVVLFGWDDGPCYVHLDAPGNTLVYDHARSVPNQAFSQTESVTLFNLHAQDYQQASFTLAVDDKSYRLYTGFSAQQALEIAQILQAVQWNKLDGAPEGFTVGEFSFPDAKQPYCNIAVYSSKRLVCGGLEAELSTSQWMTICRLMCGWSTLTDQRFVTQVGKQTYYLNVNGADCTFALSVQDQDADRYIGGFCTVFGGEHWVCYGFDGEVFILEMSQGDAQLLPGYNGIETFDIPDGTIFTEPIVDILPEE